MLVQPRPTKPMGRSYVRPQIYLIFVVFAVLAAYQPAKGQESLQIPALVLPKPGIAENIPKDVMTPRDVPSVDALSSPSIGRALVSLFKDSIRRTRSAQDVSLFRNLPQ
jgi:hypothetical protein